MQILCKLGHSQINWGEKNLVALAGTICSLLILFISEPQHPFPIHFETCFPVAMKRGISRETNHPSICRWVALMSILLWEEAQVRGWEEV